MTWELENGRRRGDGYGKRELGRVQAGLGESVFMVDSIMYGRVDYQRIEDELYDLSSGIAWYYAGSTVRLASLRSPMFTLLSLEA